MDRQHGVMRYTSTKIEDHSEGYTGMALDRTNSGATTRVATVIFWDACGQFLVETLNADVPLEIMEQLIAEAKDLIKVR